MPIMTIAAIAAIAGGASSLMGAGQSGTSYGGATPYQYIPQYSQPADATWNSILQAQYPYAQGVPSQVSPLLQRALQTQAQAPYGGYSQAGQQAGAMYPGIAQQDVQTAALLQALGLGAASGGAQVMQTAFDPRQQLYNRTVQQLQDQVRAANTAAGVATSPYGAGLEGQAMSNFNIDWQNQQLQREAQGLMSYLQGNQLAGADLTSALSTLGQAPQNILAGGQVPVATQADIANYLNQAASGYSGGVGQALAPGASIQSQIIPYLYAGQGAGGNAFNQYALNRAFAANQQQQGFGGLVQGLNAFSQSPAGQSTNNWLGGIFGQQQPSMANVYGSGSVDTVPYGGYSGAYFGA